MSCPAKITSANPTWHLVLTPGCLPGADLVDVMFSLAIQREVLKRRTTDPRFDQRRSIYRARRDEQARLKMAALNPYVDADPRGYFQEVASKGEYQLLKEQGLLPPECADVSPEDRVAGESGN